MRGLSTRPVQKPALSPPRISTIATRSAKRPSGSAPTSARAGAPDAASATTSVKRRRKRKRGDDGIGLASCARRRGASIGLTPRLGRFPPSFAPRRAEAGVLRASRPFTLHSAASADMVSSIRNRGFAVMAALAMLCRAGAWCALMGCAAAYAAEVEPHAAAKKVCLSAAGNARNRQVAPPARAVRRAQGRRRAAQGRAAVGETLPHRRGFRLRDHPPASGWAPRACPDGGRDGEDRLAPDA